MTDEVLETIEEARFSRRSLLVKGGLTAAGLTALGSPATVGVRREPARTADTIRFAVVTHGDTGSFWSVFKKGVDQATNDLKARGHDAPRRSTRTTTSRSRWPGSTPRSPPART